MTDTTLDKVNELLTEEKWTRAALAAYTVANFRELDEVLDAIVEPDDETAVLSAAEEHLTHTKNSIIGLYLSGIIRVRRQPLDDVHLVTLIDLFMDNHKWAIVRFLSERILSFGENRVALRVLAQCFENDNDEDGRLQAWERLIRVDFDEADIVREIARRKHEAGDEAAAVSYYKKAIHRYINKNDFNRTREMWQALLELAPGETEFFYHVEAKTAKVMSEASAAQLLEMLYPRYMVEEDWDTAIRVLKRILQYDSRNERARTDIVECYRRRHASHSHLEEYIRISSLTQSPRNVHDAIADFEKHIAFDAGNYVFHRTWGVGRIKEVSGDSIVINFLKKKGHVMSLKMAVNALATLSADHIWVQRVTRKKAALRKQVKDDPIWTLKTIIRSFDNAADMKRVKAELVPGILTPSEWSSWSTKARALLKTEESFGNVPDHPDVYVVRDQPVPLVEKTLNKFTAEKDFFGRVRTLFDFIRHAETAEIEIESDSDAFREMLEHFLSVLRKSDAVDHEMIASLLVARRISDAFPAFRPEVDLSFSKYFDRIADVPSIFIRLDSADLRKEFLSAVRKEVAGWPIIYTKLAPIHLQRDIIVMLEEAGHAAMLQGTFTSLLDGYRDNREAVVWFIRYCRSDEWFKQLAISEERILITLVHILDLTYRDITNRNDVSGNRKLNRQVHTFLFKDGNVETFLSGADEEAVARVFTLVEDVRDLEPTIRRNLRVLILDRFPGFRFYGEDERETVSRGRFFVLAESLFRKQDELKSIREEEIPKNSKEIATAREYGDLSENAEYKAAKERQEMLNATMTRLQEEIERAEVIRADEIESDRIGFGTRVLLRNPDTNREEQFVILGPWESDPNTGVISYLSPFGAKLLNHRSGDELTFEINDRQYHYLVSSVDGVDLSEYAEPPAGY